MHLKFLNFIKSIYSMKSLKLTLQCIKYICIKKKFSKSQKSLSGRIGREEYREYVVCFFLLISNVILFLNFYLIYIIYLNNKVDFLEILIDLTFSNFYLQLYFFEKSHVCLIQPPVIQGWFPAQTTLLGSRPVHRKVIVT